jgi:lipopolysaccharide cholinephosphotransferase
MKEMSLDEIRFIQVKILKEVSDFCNNNNINYFLSGGTLLGAVRHKGYIPWDDDIDIMMPRPDYEHFLKLFNISNRSENIKVLANEIDSSFPYTFAKVVDCNTYLIEDTSLKFPMGVNIDIFPIDGLSNSLKESNKFIKRIGLLKNMYSLKIIEKREGRSILKEMILKLSKLILYFIKIPTLVEKIILYARKYSYEQSDYVGCIVWGYGERERMNKVVFESSIDLEFEDFYFKVPIGYDNYLESLYGNYMQLPPIEKRVSHHSFKAYWK